MDDHVHKWTAWIAINKTYLYPNGTYLESWEERQCKICYVVERKNYKRTKIS